MEQTPAEGPPMSKNRLKKLRRDQEWEANREKRKAIRKEKQKERKERKRAVRDQAAAQKQNGTGDSAIEKAPTAVKGVKEHQGPRHVQVPVTIVLDCGFEDLMTDSEHKSLASQITRCYSDNHKAPYQAHLVISSFGGHLKERYDTVLAGHHRSWKGVRFLEQDCMEAADQAKAWMRAPDGGHLAGALAPSDEASAETEDRTSADEVVYLTSDSPHTLSSLSPYSTYIIGGIVDKNRHKGICYKKAMNNGVKTARLPIGEHMQMTSRAVLTTNHVNEIMLRWLECGDWGEAFMKVMPKRKGGVLKQTSAKEKRVASPVTPDIQSQDSSSEEGGVPVGEATERGGMLDQDQDLTNNKRHQDSPPAEVFSERAS